MRWTPDVIDAGAGVDERGAHDAKVQVDLVRITGMQRALDAVKARRDDVRPVAVAEELEAAQVRERGRVTLREKSTNVSGAFVIPHNLTIIDVLRTGPDLDRTPRAG